MGHSKGVQVMMMFPLIVLILWVEMIDDLLQNVLWTLQDIKYTGNKG